MTSRLSIEEVQRKKASGTDFSSFTVCWGNSLWLLLAIIRVTSAFLLNYAKYSRQTINWQESKEWLGGGREESTWNLQESLAGRGTTPVEAIVTSILWQSTPLPSAPSRAKVYFTWWIFCLLGLVDFVPCSHRLSHGVPHFFQDLMVSNVILEDKIL